MLAGYFSGRFQVLVEGSSAILSRFIFVVSLPALIFISLSRVSLEDFFDWPFLGALGGGMLATFCLSLVVARIVFPDSLTAVTPLDNLVACLSRVCVGGGSTGDSSPSSGAPERCAGICPGAAVQHLCYTLECGDRSVDSAVGLYPVGPLGFLAEVAVISTNRRGVVVDVRTVQSAAGQI